MATSRDSSPLAVMESCSGRGLGMSSVVTSFDFLGVSHRRRLLLTASAAAAKFGVRPLPELFGPGEKSTAGLE